VLVVVDLAVVINTVILFTNQRTIFIKKSLKNEFSISFGIIVMRELPILSVKRCDEIAANAVVIGW
jgi:hypothetical protein